MKKSSCARIADRAYAGRKVATITALALAVVLFASGFVVNASALSVPTFHIAASATAAQRKSGGHSQPQQAQSADPNSTQKGANVIQAKGTFEVKLDPQGDADKADGSILARMSIDKKYHGDLEGAAKGTMWTRGTDVKGSAGYVAVERVTGTLNGKSGSFVLQHSGTLTRGAAVQNISVVPDSGTGQLAGITGKFLVIIAEGKHAYEFDYTLPAQ